MDCFPSTKGRKLDSEEELTDPLIAIVVLLIGILLEGGSLLGCLRTIKPSRCEMSLWRWFRESRQSELIVVLAEDMAALLGLSFALLAVGLTVITGNPVFDAIGSIGIGVLLIVVSLLVGTEVKALLIGQSASPADQERIRHFLESFPEIDTVLNLITLQLGSQIMVSVKARMHHSGSAREMIANINRCEVRLREEVPAIQWVFFEPDVTD